MLGFLALVWIGVMGTSKNPHFIPTAALRKKFLAYISCICGAAKLFSAPCIWAKSEFLEVPLYCVGEICREFYLKIPSPEDR
jgi:hypothetical protein